MRQLQMQFGVTANVDMNMVPCGGPVSEQAVLLSGSVQSVQSALPQVMGQVAQFANERWFRSWASYSNAGAVIPNLILFQGTQRASSNGDSRFAHTSNSAELALPPPPPP